MQQISLYLKGERDYVNIVGDTGPLVYPAAHVFIYRILYALTDEGRDVRSAQYIFALLYLGTVWVVMMCYREAKVCPVSFFSHVMGVFTSHFLLPLLSQNSSESISKQCLGFEI